LSEQTQTLGDFRIVGNDRPAVAECAKVLGWVKAEAPEAADCARRSASESGAVCLGAVLDDMDAVIIRNLRNGLHVRALAVEVYREDCARARSDRAPERFGVHRSCLGFDVAQHRRQPRPLDP
jgi:hypothetical protein